jgi:hypothetical protein
LFVYIYQGWARINTGLLNQTVLWENKNSRKKLAKWIELRLCGHSSAQEAYNQSGKKEIRLFCTLALAGALHKLHNQLRTSCPMLQSHHSQDHGYDLESVDCSNHARTLISTLNVMCS